MRRPICFAAVITSLLAAVAVTPSHAGEKQFIHASHAAIRASNGVVVAEIDQPHTSHYVQPQNYNYHGSVDQCHQAPACPACCPVHGHGQRHVFGWSRVFGRGYGNGRQNRPSLPTGRRYVNGRYFGNFNNRFYGPQYGNF